MKALLSAKPTEAVLNIGKRLNKLGWEVLATDELANSLKIVGVSAIPVSEYVGIKEVYPFPSTLHPRIENSLTQDTQDKIDLVLDIPYPITTGNDVGGYTLLGLAAKGNRYPVMDLRDMETLLNDFSQNSNNNSNLKNELIEKANYNICKHYYSLLNKGIGSRGLPILLEKSRELSSGENPYQTPSYLYEHDSDELSLTRFKQECGEDPCFTNMADFDSIIETYVRLACSFKINYGKMPYIVIGAKHGNPCGVGVSWENKADAIKKAFWGNPTAIWGGEVILNFEIDGIIANLLLKDPIRGEKIGNSYWMLHVVVTPKVTKEAVSILKKNTIRKVFTNESLYSPQIRNGLSIRYVRGGALIQPPANYVIKFDSVQWPNGKLNKICYLDLLIAWAVAYTSNCGGNEVSLVKNCQLLSVGGGPSTSDASISAITRAEHVGHAVGDSIFCADAFLPFIDSAEILCHAKVKGGIYAGGGKKYGEVLNYFKNHDVMIGNIEEKNRGFCRH